MFIIRWSPGIICTVVSTVHKYCLDRLAARGEEGTQLWEGVTCVLENSEQTSYVSDIQHCSQKNHIVTINFREVSYDHAESMKQLLQIQI